MGTLEECEDALHQVVGKANTTAIVTDTCGSMGPFMSATCVQLLQIAWDEFQAGCGSHLSAGYATNVVVRKNRDSSRVFRANEDQCVGHLSVVCGIRDIMVSEGRD